MGGADAGAKIVASIPACAQYAATDAPAFPDESSAALRIPTLLSADTITAEPLSLKDPVGFINSSLA